MAAACRAHTGAVLPAGLTMATNEIPDGPPWPELPASSGAFSGSPPMPGHGSVEAVRAVFLDLYTEHFAKVVRFVMIARGADRAAAEDAAQEAFLEGWRAVQNGTWTTIGLPEGWLRTVALYRHDRPPGSRRRIPTVGGVDDLLTEIPHPQLDPGDLAALTVDVMNALTDLDRETRAVMAFTMDGFPDSAIAIALGIDAQRVRNLRTKGRTRLKRALAPLREQEGGAAR
jgi:DNA-directed RNA polymerase specialized sigma24 family protein